jgi:hypothetical protein
MVPWLARARLEDLYLPAEVLSWMPMPYEPERALRLFAGHVGQAQAVVDARAKQGGPSRKGPCPCGSGKKYKRCCGEER